MKNASRKLTKFEHKKCLPLKFNFYILLLNNPLRHDHTESQRVLLIKGSGKICTIFSSRAQHFDCTS